MYKSRVACTTGRKSAEPLENSEVAEEGKRVALEYVRLDKGLGGDAVMLPLFRNDGP